MRYFTKTLPVMTLIVLGLSNASCEMFNRDDDSASSSSRTDPRYSDDSRTSRDARTMSGTRYEAGNVSGSDGYDAYFTPSNSSGMH